MVSEHRGRSYRLLHAIRASVGGAACLAGLVIGAMALVVLAFPAPGVQAADIDSFTPAGHFVSTIRDQP